MIVSVDDHVVKPPHVWQQWLPAKHRSASPRVERHRLGELNYTGGTTYTYDLDPPDGSGQWCDIWFYEDGMYPHKLYVAAVGFDRGHMTLSPIRFCVLDFCVSGSCVSDFCVPDSSVPDSSGHGEK